MHLRRASTLLALALLASGCGEQRAGVDPADGAPRGPARTGPSEGGLYVAQEVWLTFHSPEFEGYGLRKRRPREEAEALAKALHERARRGDDVGLMAQQESSAPGARAEGYFASTLPVDPAHPDDRDRALMAVREGEVTALVEWKGGFWFAKRITPLAARPFAERFAMLLAQGSEAQLYRARARAIVIPYVGSFPYRYEVKATKEQAYAQATGVLAQIRRGTPFADLAAASSWDDSGNVGGNLKAFDARGKGSPWITRFDQDYPARLLETLFTAPIGLYPEPLDTVRGIVVLEILERRKVTDAELVPR